MQVNWGVFDDPVPQVESHRLSVAAAPGARGRALRPLSAMVPAALRRALAVKYDPWCRLSVRSSNTIVLTDSDLAPLGPRLSAFMPQVRVLSGDDVLPAAVALLRIVSVTSGRAGPRSRSRADLAAAAVEVGAAVSVLEQHLDATRRLLEAEAGLAPDPAPLEALVHELAWGKHHSLATRLSRVASQLSLVDQDISAGYLALAELVGDGRSSVDVGAAAAGLLRQADATVASSDLDRSLRLTATALELLFHRELHSDGLESALVQDPEQWLQPLRNSRVGRLLTTSSQRPPPGPPVGMPSDLVVLPGAYPRFAAPVIEELGRVPGLTVRTLDMGSRHRPFGWMSVDLHILRFRLSRALGREATLHRQASAELASADVVFVDWADKGAVWASLVAPPTARLIIRIHSIDALRAWVHLVDWGRVSDLICVSDHIAAVVRGQLGSRLDTVRLHVVPNVVPLVAAAALPRPEQALRTLGMVGWAQRVKDPLWTVELLARLRQHDPAWRLLMIGRDFPARQAVSGQEYAARFRQRAMEDDVRDGIEYVDFTEDLAPVLAEVGFVVSSSVRESWPVGPMEGVAAGAVPVIREWPMFSRFGAAAAMYPQDWVVNDVEEAAERVRAHASAEAHRAAATEARAWLQDQADPVQVAARYCAICLGESGELGYLAVAGPPDVALARARQVADRAGVDLDLLRSALAAAKRSGDAELEWQLRRAVVASAPSVGRITALRELMGRLRETDSGWWPQVSSRPAPATGTPEGVLHVLKVSLPHRQSGYTVRTRYLLEGQLSHDLQLSAATALDFPPPEQREALTEKAVEMVEGVTHHRLVRSSAQREPVDEYLHRWAQQLSLLVAEKQPELIHVHSGHRGFETAVVALSVAAAAGVPVIYEVRGFFEAMWTKEVELAEQGQWYRRRWETELRCMSAAAAVVTLSESMKEDIVARGVPASKVFVVPNGVDTSLFRPRPRRPELVRRWGLDGAFVFGYISNLDHEREGHELLIRAAAQLREAGIACKALIIGEGKRRAELESLTARENAEDLVVFTGKVPHSEIADHYALYDAFVVPRVQERAARLVTPLKPYEAMASGIPLVVSDLPALVEIVGQDRGAVFRAGEATDLTRVLRELAADPEGRERRAERAREWVIRERRWKDIAGRYREVYRQARLGGAPVLPRPESDHGVQSGLAEVRREWERLRSSGEPASQVEAALVEALGQEWGAGTEDRWRVEFCQTLSAALANHSG